MIWLCVIPLYLCSVQSPKHLTKWVTVIPPARYGTQYHIFAKKKRSRQKTVHTHEGRVIYLGVRVHTPSSHHWSA